MTGSTDSNTSEENKGLMAKTHTACPLPKANVVKKTSAKVALAETSKGKIATAKGSQDPKVIKTNKDLTGSETLSAAVLIGVLEHQGINQINNRIQAEAAAHQKEARSRKLMRRNGVVEMYRSLAQAESLKKLAFKPSRLFN